VYCDNLAQTIAFYQELLDTEPMLSVERVAAFDAGEGTVLLLFQRGASDQPFETAGGVVPGHTSTGPAHIAFAIDRADVPAWLDRLTGLHIPVESRVDWPRGGHSIYFRDPDGRSVELATPGTWANY
jgi:catechol 2,3-dioxygenase-like lactoylglutathione lyase family enzyme